MSRLSAPHTIMSKASVEDIKLASNGLRGQLVEQFADTALSTCAR